MKLNADIVCSALKERYPVKMTGPKNAKLTIAYPELYAESETEFLSDHLYLATLDHLPSRPRLQENSVIVVIGDGGRLTHYRDKCCLIIIREKVDFFEVHKLLIKTFDRYSRWEERLFDIFLDAADLQEIIDCSFPIFMRPIHVLDASFHFLAHSDCGNYRFQSPSGRLKLDSISEYLSSFELITDRHGATLINTGDLQFLCVNLFDRNDVYIGCIYIEGGGRPFRDGDKALAEFTAGIIEKAIEKNPAILTSENATIKSAVLNLINEYPLTVSQKWKLNMANHDRTFICISLHSSDLSSRLPKNYICRAFESVFPGSFAVIKDNSIVCFIDISLLADKDGNYNAKLNRELKIFLNDTRSIAGISNSFTELYNARISFLQAEAAIENGMITNPESELFYFQSNALMSMIINSTGDLPPEAYFSERLKGLIKHDKEANVSYLETLRVFLMNNLSYKKTADNLYIHRSTVVDRISRIERELDVDLNDHDTRLQLEIILKAMEIESMIQQAKE